MPKKIEISVLAVLFFFVIYCALIIGISWDEGFEITRGNERLKYLFSLGSYESYWKPPNEEFVPGFYNSFAIFITKIFPNKYETEIWRLINAFFSILTVFGIYKISSNLFNKNIGKIVFLLCFINPIFFGHMSMNSKDTIVAFAHVWTTYIFLRYLQNQNLNGNYSRYIILAGLTIGLGSGVRIPFIITLVPLFIFAILDIFLFKKITNNKFSFKKFIIHLIIILSISYLITISCWPHVHDNIFIEPFKLAIELKNQIFGLPWILFNGQYFNTNQLPNYYIIVNFIYKTPEFILLCYLIFACLVLIDKKFFSSQFNSFWNKIFLIILIYLFPVIYFVFFPYRLYDGLRLFLYLIPYFSIIPGITIYYLILKFNSSVSKILLGGVGVLFVYYFFVFIIITPYHYTYLNKLNGNFFDSHKRFENDYWGISIKELVKKIPTETNLISSNKKVKISFCGVSNSLVKDELNKLKNLKYVEKNLFLNDFDYIVMTNRAVKLQNNNSSSDVKSCFVNFKGEDLISVKRNGLVLSTLRSKF